MGTQKNRPNETVLLSTQNTCLNTWVRNYLQFYTENFCLSTCKPVSDHIYFTVLTLYLPETTFVHLLYCLDMFLDNLLYCKQYGPRSDCYSVCFHDKILFEVHLNLCSRRKKQTTFQDINIGEKGYNGPGFSLSKYHRFTKCR